MRRGQRRHSASRFLVRSAVQRAALSPSGIHVLPYNFHCIVIICGQTYSGFRTSSAAFSRRAENYPQQHPPQKCGLGRLTRLAQVISLWKEKTEEFRRSIFAVLRPILGTGRVRADHTTLDASSRPAEALYPNYPYTQKDNPGRFTGWPGSLHGQSIVRKRLRARRPACLGRNGTGF
jgi:hypothetical protein